MALRQDAFELRFSENFDTKGLQETAVNLVLEESTQTNTTLIGNVTDGTDPVEGATVKAFDEDGVPFAHTLTDDQGDYVFQDLPVGTYSVGVVKDGYIMTALKGASLSKGSTATLDFEIEEDQTLKLGTIAGKLKILDTNEPLSNGKITLFDSENVVVATTYTINDGEFAFYNIPNGEYKVIATATGYITSSPMSVTIKEGSVINIEMNVEVDTRTFNGTVNGVVRTINGKVISGCFVGLYNVTKDEETGRTREILVKTTRTNSSGQYMFGGVEEGSYVVKAKLSQETVTIDSF